MAQDLPISSAALNDLRATAWEGPQTRDWGPIFQRSLGWVCAHDDDRLVGFVNIAWDGGAHAFLLDTTVHHDYQRRGIGTALIREAVALLVTIQEGRSRPRGLKAVIPAAPAGSRSHAKFCLEYKDCR